MHVNKPLFFALTLAVCLLADQRASAQCVEVAFKNDAGQLINPPGLVPGMMIGDAPVFNDKLDLPVHRDIEVARTAPCDDELVRNIRRLYNMSCTSERARQQAAETNDKSIDVILQRCSDLSAALNVSD
jgi:hypothetical protein